MGAVGVGNGRRTSRYAIHFKVVPVVYNRISLSNKIFIAQAAAHSLIRLQALKSQLQDIPKMALKLYANLISQPSRAAEWALRIKKLDHEFVVADFGTAIFTSPEFLKLNPNGLIPVLQHGDFSLFEGNAIMQYLAEKFGWTDLYPADVQAHAKVNQYLHWHHTNARLITPKVLVPLMHTKQSIATPEEAVFVKDTPALLDKLAGLMEKFLVKDFVAETDHVTIADLAAYCEFVQVELMGIYDFSKYPKLSAWLNRMKSVPHHDEIHEPLDQFLTTVGLKANP